jgi:hypothetical protein
LRISLLDEQRSRGSPPPSEELVDGLADEAGTPLRSALSLPASGHAYSRAVTAKQAPTS